MLIVLNNILTSDMVKSEEWMEYNLAKARYMNEDSGVAAKKQLEISMWHRNNCDTSTFVKSDLSEYNHDKIRDMIDGSNISACKPIMLWGPMASSKFALYSAWNTQTL